MHSTRWAFVGWLIGGLTLGGCSIDDRELAWSDGGAADARADHAAFDSSVTPGAADAPPHDGQLSSMTPDAAATADGATLDAAATPDGPPTADSQCGNGRVEEGEECDDGNTSESDGCRSDCRFTCLDSDPTRDCHGESFCVGDGACNAATHVCVVKTPVPEGASCPSDVPGSVCRAGRCAPPGCGDGIVTGKEECDDGNALSGDGCDNDCRWSCLATDVARDCHPANPCQTATCGPAHTCSAPVPVANAQSCGSATAPASCRGGVCIQAGCGNGQVDTAIGEECDDGNKVDGDGCDQSCRYTCVSTDAARNCAPKDACAGASQCNDQTHVCAARTPLGEGATCATGSVCRAGLCTSTSCGNKLLEPGEECDDGNKVSGDGCEANCRWTCSATDTSRDCHATNPCLGTSSCGTSHTCSVRVPFAEGASCGSASAPAYCRTGVCSPARCGNGIVEPGENCDDKNSVAGDGCENNCTWSCAQASSRACSGAKGNCAKGSQTCTNGLWSACSIAPKSADSCVVAGDDADCDGTPNGKCTCIEGDTRPCPSKITRGICVQGTQKCASNQWANCANYIDPRPIDCTSGLDNNCDGIADNQGSTCKCPANTSQACLARPGSKDGVGVCTAGKQNCVLASDKGSTDWGACTGVVNPSSEVCNSDGKDENCNGQVNEGCACLNGVSSSCGCNGIATCTNGQLGACSVPERTYYRDADGDGHGNPALTTAGCTPPAGYVSNNDDCCDADALAFAGQTNFYNTASKCGNFDYNCDGSETPPTTNTLSCDGHGGCVMVNGTCQLSATCPGCSLTGCAHVDTVACGQLGGSHDSFSCVLINAGGTFCTSATSGGLNDAQECN